MEKNDLICLLYVDDESLNRDLFSINFRKQYKVITANSGFDGLNKLKLNHDISVVISDMKMPGMNGVEFIRKAKREHQNLIFFILTGFDITDEISDAMNENLINKYFRKPFSMKEIDRSIRETFRNILNSENGN
jgi:two-component system, response regulator, stage 0 sporulation protein F